MWLCTSRQSLTRIGRLMAPVSFSNVKGSSSANSKVLKEVMPAYERGGIELMCDPLVNAGVSRYPEKRVQNG